MGRALHRLLPLEVKYRLFVVFVTDHPEPGRSCFQIVDFGMGKTDGLQGLHGVKDLEIFETTVREYESLVRQIFPLVERWEPGPAAHVVVAR